MLEMRQDSVRTVLVKAFYREEPRFVGWLFLGFIFIGILSYMFKSDTLAMALEFVLFLAWIVAKLVYYFSAFFGVYDQYHSCVKKAVFGVNQKEFLSTYFWIVEMAR